MNEKVEGARHKVQDKKNSSKGTRHKAQVVKELKITLYLVS
jgi:hypothetical protein